MSQGGITSSSWGSRLSPIAVASPIKRRVYHRATAKTTLEQVREILDIRNRRGWSAARIAVKMNLPASTVQSVLNGCGSRTVEVMR